MRRQAVLIGATAGAWALLAVPAFLLLGGPPLGVSGAAVIVCLIPAALTLLLVDRLRERPPEEKVVIVLAATFIRILLAVGLGVLVYLQAPLVRANGAAFIAWAIVFYLVTLAVETGLLVRDATQPTQPGPPGAVQ